MLAESNAEGEGVADSRLRYFEVDFASVLKKKSRVILRHSDLYRNLKSSIHEGQETPAEVPHSIGGLIDTNRYKMIGADLRNIQDLHLKSKAAGLSPE